MKTATRLRLKSPIQVASKSLIYDACPLYRLQVTYILILMNNLLAIKEIIWKIY